jgi:hypothetical protein
MDVMLKISIVLLTTTFFAGLLIVDPYGSSPVSFHQMAAAKLPNAVNVQATPVVAAPVVALAAQPDVLATGQETRLFAMADAEPDMLTPAQPARGVQVQQRADKPQRERIVQYRLRRHG